MSRIFVLQENNCKKAKHGFRIIPNYIEIILYPTTNL